MTSTPIPSEAVEHGEVFTRRWVVELILDFLGYTADADLASKNAVEPSVGHGAFIGPMVERLSASLRQHHRPLSDAAGAIRGYDLLESSVLVCRTLVVDLLVRDGWDADESRVLAEKWITQGDFLLRPREPQSADFVIGNPPYIRLEEVPEERSAAYRRACPTMGGRADIYVGFIEVGLDELKEEGQLGFIVADRWQHNAYGAALRSMVAGGFAVDVNVVMHDVDAFEEDVSAYPAITIIRRGRQASALVADTTSAFGPDEAARLLAWADGSDTAPLRAEAFEVARLPHWFSSGDLWPAGSPGRLNLLEDLNERFRPLEDPLTGTKVGIGVATGADGVFVTRESDVVETDRLLPLSMAADTKTGTLLWSGHYLVNPWRDSGGLVDITEYPRLAKYFDEHADALTRRNIAKKQSQPDRWFRTIDAVHAHLTEKPKLLFPDMKMQIHPVLDPGGLYPHHNLYYVISEVWDLRVLGGLLLSRVAEMFVDAYCVKMRGGTLRFQAQYLRRIRVPAPESISEQDAKALASAFEMRDADAATQIAIRLYGLSPADAEAIAV